MKAAIARWLRRRELSVRDAKSARRGDRDVGEVRGSGGFYFFLFMAATRARNASRLEEVEGAGATDPSAATPAAEGPGEASPAYT